MHQTLRGPPVPRSAVPQSLNSSHTSQASPSNPIVESWLESIHPSPSNNISRTATTLTEYNPFSLDASRRGKPVLDPFNHLQTASNRDTRLSVVQFALRAMSSMFSMVVLIIISTYKQPYYSLAMDPIWMSMLTLYSISLLCNAVDLIASVVRRGRDLAKKVQALVDFTIATASAICVGFATYQLVDMARYSFYDVPYQIVVTCFGALIMIIHSFLFFSHFTTKRQPQLSSNQVRRLRRPRKNQMSRIVVLPPGATTMAIHPSQPEPAALARPFPIGMSPMVPRRASTGASQFNQNQNMDWGRIPGSGITAILRSGSLIAIEPPTTADPVRPIKQDIPRRKPVASRSLAATNATNATTSRIPPSGIAIQVETQYNTPPPGPDYQPDEAEVQRAARGEAQAQWVPRDLMGF
ncbi:hypothetical protein V8F20_004348 [Naviculisporaceae sp. PSN 640]